MTWFQRYGSVHLAVPPTLHSEPDALTLSWYRSPIVRRGHAYAAKCWSIHSSHLLRFEQSKYHRWRYALPHPNHEIAPLNGLELAKSAQRRI
ncbi:Uncharacterised protein [Vibrio cholerae]|nr:Uncharacterised protein [Vibrio cholerae]